MWNIASLQHCNARRFQFAGLQCLGGMDVDSFPIVTLSGGGLMILWGIVES